MTITITITGPRGSGKTTAAERITQALHDAKFSDFTVEDVHGDNVQKGLPVAGYTPTQNAEAIKLVNENKHVEENLLRLIDALTNSQTLEGEMFLADARWLAIAKTDLEKGFMALNRAIFKPQRITGDLG